MSPKIQIFILFAASVFLFQSLGAQPIQWNLIWQDEFTGTGAPDVTKWGYDVGLRYNNEVQYDTKDRRENCRVENGLLILEARQDKWNNQEFTSARIKTEGKASFKHVRIDVRAKLPRGRGTWPAIWTLGNDKSNGDWPARGEIDIMENVGFDPEKIHWNVHTLKYNHANGSGKGSSGIFPRTHENFHVYSIEWFEDRIDFLVDSVKQYSYLNENMGWQSWPFNTEHYIILNLAIGGEWGGLKGIDSTLFPHRFEIDYVRVYKPSIVSRLNPIGKRFIVRKKEIDYNVLGRFLREN